MNRLEGTRIVLRRVDREPVVATLGHTAYDLFASGDRALNLYTWGAMGLTSSIGLGLALARPDTRVFAFDGDGAVLMNLGSLATIACQAPKNLVLVIWDNEVYGTTGGQKTATGAGADLAAVARAVGIESAVLVRNERSLEETMEMVWAKPGPWVVVVKVEETIPTVRPPFDPVYLKQRFVAALSSTGGNALTTSREEL